jgi:hypothetical protein
MYRIIGADNNEYGPVTAEQIRQWIVEGRANAETRVAAEGSSDWRPLGSITEFQILLAPTAPSAPIAPTPSLAAPSSFTVRKTHPLAVTGMVLGLVSLVGLCCCYGLPFNVLGLAFSIVALIQIRSQPEQYDGNGLAITGLILSILSILAAVCFFAVGMVAGFANAGNNL